MFLFLNAVFCWTLIVFVQDLALPFQNITCSLIITLLVFHLMIHSDNVFDIRGNH